MTTPRFSSDPEQNAEMLAQWHFENRLMGINPYRDDPPDDYYPEDHGWDEDDDQDDDGQPDEAQEWHDFDPE
jgi:hypothetical protein